jgi:hypothetical protein
MKTERRSSGQLRDGFYAGYSADTMTIPKQLVVPKSELRIGPKWSLKLRLMCSLMPQTFIG